MCGGVFSVLIVACEPKVWKLCASLWWLTGVKITPLAYNYVHIIGSEGRKTFTNYVEIMINSVEIIIIFDEIISGYVEIISGFVPLTLQCCWTQTLFTMMQYNRCRLCQEQPVSANA